MKAISVFNNKGGVGKTTLTFHLAHALAEMGHRTLVIDLDPQCNLTILGMDEEVLHEIWLEEDDFIEDFQAAREKLTPSIFEGLISKPRSIHFLLKPAEDGAAEIGKLAPPFRLASNLDLIPGRLTMHLYEDKIAGRWSDVYQGDPLAIRTITKPREIAETYAKENGYDFVIMDTSPSLGALNKVIISMTDGFLIPCMPDMFSLLKESFYTSVHYLVRPRSDSPICCEIQVRTLFEEIWGEVDHALNYPTPSSNLSCREQLRVLAKLVGAGSRLVDSIFRSDVSVAESTQADRPRVVRQPLNSDIP